MVPVSCLMMLVVRAKVPFLPLEDMPPVPEAYSGDGISCYTT